MIEGDEYFGERHTKTPLDCTLKSVVTNLDVFVMTDRIEEIDSRLTQITENVNENNANLDNLASKVDELYDGMQSILSFTTTHIDNLESQSDYLKFHVDMLLEDHYRYTAPKYSVIFGNSVIYFESLKWYNKMLIKLLGGKIKAL